MANIYAGNITRRAALGGLAGLATVGLWGQGARGALSDADAALRDLYDRLAAMRAPEPMRDLLGAFDPSGLSADAKSDYRTVQAGLDRLIALRRCCPFGTADGGSPYVVSQRHGLHLKLRDLAAGDVEGQQKLAPQIDAETDQIRAAAAQGFVPPDFVLEAVLASLSGATLPAARRQADLLQELRQSVPPGDGVWRFPNGDAYYAAKLQSSVGMAMSPDEVARWVADASALLTARADRLLSQQGLTGGSLGARFRLLGQRPDFLYANTDQGRTEAVAAMNAALDQLPPLFARAFHQPFDPAVRVRRMSAADEAAGKRGYRNASGYFPDFHALAERPRWTLKTVAFHEVFPGHLLQIATQNKVAPHPLRLRFAPGYFEGWAIYVETWADSIGLLDPVDQLGFLQSVLNRLARFTLDFGIHVQRWSRTEAVARMADMIGFPLIYPFDDEIDRACVEPAGYAGDAVMMLKIRQLQQTAQDRLGANFDPRDFHDAILERGALPAHELETSVMQMIEQRSHPMPAR